MADARSGEVWGVTAIRSPEGRMRRRLGADAPVSGATGPRDVPIEPLQAAQRANPRTDVRGSIEVGERRFLSIIAYSFPATHYTMQIKLVEVATGATHAVMPPDFRDYCPAWDPEGKFLYLLS